MMGFSALLRQCKPYANHVGQAFARSFQSKIGSARVTRENFPQVLPWFTDRIYEADFVALDLELTGVLSAPWQLRHHFDTTETMYHKVKASAESFGILQVGVCPFKWEAERERFVAYPLSFYVFPRNKFNMSAVNDKFLTDSSSLEFLAGHGFDFNTCVFQGISYFSREQEEMAKVQRNISPRKNFLREREFRGMMQFKDPADVLLAEKIKARVDTWRRTIISDGVNIQSPNDLTKSEGMISTTAMDGTQKLGRDSLIQKEDECSSTTDTICNHANKPTPFVRPSLVLEMFGDYQVQLALQVINYSFSDIVAMVKTEELVRARTPVNVFYTTSMEEKNLLMENLDKSNVLGWRKIEALAGFRRVIDALVTSKKLVVGHNCILDFAHIYSKFFATLPSTVGQFSDGLRKNFPYMFDTKHLASFNPQLRGGERKLFNLFARSYMDKTNRVVVDIADEISSLISSSPGGSTSNSARSRGTEGVEIHDAGVDAFMTGCLFAKLCVISNIDPWAVHQLPWLFKSGAKNGLLNHMNLLQFGFKSSSVLDLETGKEVIAASNRRDTLARQADCSSLALIWGFLPDTNITELELLIQKAVKGFLQGTISVSSIDGSSAFVKFSSPDDTQKFFQLIKKPPEDSPNVLALGNTGIRAGSFATYERICKANLRKQQLAECAEILELDVCMEVNILADGEGADVACGGGAVEVNWGEHNLDEPNEASNGIFKPTDIFGGELVGEEEALRSGLDVEHDHEGVGAC